MSAYFDSLNRRTRAARPIVAPARPPAPRAVGVASPEPTPRRSSPIVHPEYGSLRERLLVSANGKPLRTLLFAGCDGREGCSRVAREFAETLALSGLRVLLVGEGRGLPTTDWGHGQLTVVLGPEGTHPDKDRFFRDREFAAWVEKQQGAYDYVLLDAPPLLRAADGTLMARLCDGVVIVVRAEATKRQSLIQAREQLVRAGANVVGVVLNGVPNRIPGFLRPYFQMG